MDFSRRATQEKEYHRQGSHLRRVVLLHRGTRRIGRQAYALRHAGQVPSPPLGELRDALAAATLRLPHRVVGVLQLQRHNALGR